MNLSLQNSLGMKVADIANISEQEAGNYKIGYTFELAKGMYWLRLQTPVGSKTVKLIVQ
ncbi:MAG: hypothetical protein SGJ10_08845 [Bacteroidota bacterium]|nr:hypothetical protein [Bacteroidota bacterium]